MHIPLSRTIKAYIEERQLIKELRRTYWHLSPYRRFVLIAEYEDWCKHYRPINLTGTTVLDVGAGEGETAFFFLKHGATKVICVESNPVCFQNLIRNAQYHPIVPVLQPFSNHMLTRFKYDFLKMDIEGYEEQILSTSIPTPAVIEVHGLSLMEKFKAKGYVQQPVDPEQETAGCVRYFYWRS